MIFIHGSGLSLITSFINHKINREFFALWSRVRELVAIQKEFVEDQRRKALDKFDGAIKGLQAMVNHARQTGGDATSLSAQLGELVKQRATVAQSFENALKQLA